MLSRFRSRWDNLGQEVVYESIDVYRLKKQRCKVSLFVPPLNRQTLFCEVSGRIPKLLDKHLLMNHCIKAYCFPILSEPPNSMLPRGADGWCRIWVIWLFSSWECFLLKREYTGYCGDLQTACRSCYFLTDPILCRVLVGLVGLHWVLDAAQVSGALQMSRWHRGSPVRSLQNLRQCG